MRVDVDKIITGMHSRIAVLDCGDNSCIFAKVRGGVRTNHGCHCHEHWSVRWVISALPALLDSIDKREQELLDAKVALEEKTNELGESVREMQKWGDTGRMEAALVALGY